MDRPSKTFLNALKALGQKAQKASSGEVYRLDSRVIWIDYSGERKGRPGTFFHGTRKKAFELLYRKHPESFFLVFLLGLANGIEGIVVSGHRFNEMFRNKATDKTGAWKYIIQFVGGRYVVKVYGVGDFDVTDGLHNYQYLGLNSDDSFSVRKALSPQPHQVVVLETAVPTSILGLVATHEAAQGVLLLLGRLLEYDTYTPDKSREWNRAKLGELATLPSLPSFTGYTRILKSAGEIDVIWFSSHGYPSHCFEVEHSTGVRPGLLREYQIAHGTSARFFIVGPEEYRRKFDVEIEAEPFRAIKERYQFRSYDELIQLYEQAKAYHEAKKKFGI